MEIKPHWRKWKVLGVRDQVKVTPTLAGQPSQMHITIETHTYNEINHYDSLAKMHKSLVSAIKTAEQQNRERPVFVVFFSFIFFTSI